MSVSETDVRHVAGLARLAISDQQVAGFVADLNGILQHMDVLQDVNLDGTGDDASATTRMPLRNDLPAAVQLERPREDFAPQVRDGFFLVPRLDTHLASNTGDDQ